MLPVLFLLLYKAKQLVMVVFLLEVLPLPRLPQMPAERLEPHISVQ